MSKSKILYIHVTGVSSEILKNLVLAGIRAVLCDNRPYPQAILETPCFLLSATDPTELPSKDEEEPSPPKKARLDSNKTVAEAVKPAVEELNPLLGDCEVVKESISELSKEFLAQFSIVIASRIGISDAIRLSEAVTENGGKFFMADCFGMDGACVLDLGAKHTYRPELGKKLLDITPLKTHVPLKTLFDVPLSDAVARLHKKPIPVWMRYRAMLEYKERSRDCCPDDASMQQFAEVVRAWVKESAPTLVDDAVFDVKALEKLASVTNSEVAPVCSVLGGMIGNEVIKAVSGKGEPANNTLLFDGSSCKAWTFLVKPKE